jgi:hypothetical protein
MTHIFIYAHVSFDWSLFVVHISFAIYSSIDTSYDFFLSSFPSLTTTTTTSTFCLIKGVSYRYEFTKKKRDKSYSSRLHETITIINIIVGEKNVVLKKSIFTFGYQSFYFLLSYLINDDDSITIIKLDKGGRTKIPKALLSKTKSLEIYGKCMDISMRIIGTYR